MMMRKMRFLIIFSLSVVLLQGFNAYSQKARPQWEKLNQIRRDKFNVVLPKVMRENKIDMWIHITSMGSGDPLYLDLGGSARYFIFTNRGGDRIERAVLGGGGRLLRQCGAYDIFGSARNLKEFVAERDPKRIGINMSDKIKAADGISHTDYLSLIKALGEKYAGRLVSAEKLIADFRSRRVASEIALFAEAGDITRKILEKALSNEVITPGVTTLEDVAWWIKEEHMRRGFGDTARLPAVFVRYPDGHEIGSNDHVIQRGEMLGIDFGIRYMNFGTDMKRIAYVLKEGETALPPEIQNAFVHAMKVRNILRKNTRPGRTGVETLELLFRKVEEAGYTRMEVEDKMTDLDNVEVNIGMHSTGNSGHCVGPAIWTEEPWRFQHMIQPTNLLAFEFNIYAPVPGWKRGHKVYIPMEDNVIINEDGIENLYPEITRILLIH